MTDFPKLKPFSVEELDELLKAVKKEIKKENQDGFSIDMPVMKVSLEKKDFEEAQWDSFKAAAKNDDYPEVLQDYVKDVLFKNYDNFSDKRDDLLSCFWETCRVKNNS